MKGLQKVCYRAGKHLHYKMPLILTILGSAGVVVTVVSAVRATPKALNSINEATKEKGEELTTLEKVQAAAPAYVPTVLMGASTIACIFGANALNARTQASIASAYALIDNYHKEYRKTLIDLHGKEIDEEVRNTMAHERCDYHIIDCDDPDGKVLFYDEISGETILRYERDVISAEYHFNRNFTMRGCATLNEFYKFLGMPETEYGETMGWSMSSGIMWVDFEHRLLEQDDGGIPVYAIDMVFAPDSDYVDEWL